MTWTFRFVSEGDKIEVFDPDGESVDVIPNERGIKRDGIPPDVQDLVAEYDTTAAIKGDIERAQ